MERKTKKLNISSEPVIVLILAFIWNLIAYTGARLIAFSWPHHDITTALDRRIPLVSWTVLIYFGCYAVWGINYYLCAMQEKPARDRFFCADTLSRLVCFLIFLVFPTTTVRPEITEGGVWGALMKLLYFIDSADNLFPSIHCLISWFCWIGVRKRKEIPAWYRHFSFIAALAVCVSTVTTKQHVLVDIFGGVLLAEISYYIAGLSRLSETYGRFITWLQRKISEKMQHRPK